MKKWASYKRKLSEIAVGMTKDAVCGGGSSGLDVTCKPREVRTVKVLLIGAEYWNRM